jgi:hypothetical protein
VKAELQSLRAGLGPDAKEIIVECPPAITGGDPVPVPVPNPPSVNAEGGAGAEPIGTIYMAAPPIPLPIDGFNKGIGAKANCRAG